VVTQVYGKADPLIPVASWSEAAREDIRFGRCPILTLTLTLHNTKSNPHPEALLVAGEEVVGGGPAGGAAHVVPQHVIQRQLLRDQLRVRRVADAPAA